MIAHATRQDVTVLRAEHSVERLTAAMPARLRGDDVQVERIEPQHDLLGQTGGEPIEARGRAEILERDDGDVPAVRALRRRRGARSIRGWPPWVRRDHADCQAAR